MRLRTGGDADLTKLSLELDSLAIATNQTGALVDSVVVRGSDLIELIWHGEHRWEQGSLTITYPSVLQDIAAMRRNPAAHPASIPDHDRDELLHPRPLPEPVKEE